MGILKMVIDLNKAKRKSLRERINKFTLGQEFSQFDRLVRAIKHARKHRAQCILMMGAHSIKLGLSPYIIRMMRENYFTHISMNGAASIHDFEVAYQGATSEDVEKNLKDGTFGNWEETGKIMNNAINANPENGMGELLGALCSKKKYSKESILSWAKALKIPATVHVAIGTDFIHQHPACDGAKTGLASYTDFKKMIESVTKLDKDSVVLCLGSAVILPEVFLKTLSVSRALGFKSKDFTACVIDKNIQYREMQNVVKRTTRFGYYIQGQFEEYIPLLCERLGK